MFHKIEVNGEGAAPLYAWLKQQQPGDGDSAEITWNFEKFLVDKAGNAVARFPPTTTPEQVAAVLDTYR
jgi:glutathione peroxidase